jgi:hypothetical protein
MTTVIVDGACTISAVVIPSAASCTLGFTLQTAVCSQPRLRDLAARCARALRRLPPSIRTRGRRESRVRAAPAVSRANMHKKTHTSIQVSGGSPAFPAQWFTAYSSALPGDRALLPPSPALLSASLTPASRCQDHTASPSARVALVSRNFRVHRIPPRVRDDREPPLSSGETGEVKSVICPSRLGKNSGHFREQHVRFGL